MKTRYKVLGVNHKRTVLKGASVPKRGSGSGAARARNKGTCSKASCAPDGDHCGSGYKV